jgi:uncharacterized protein (TIGR03066 family)
MKKTYSRILILLTLLTTAAYAGSGLDAKKLIGTWEGEVVATFTIEDKTHTEKIKVTMEFRKDGKVISSSETDKEKTEADYKIVGNQILVTEVNDKKTTKVSIVSITLTGTAFKAEITPASEEERKKLPPGFSMKLDLKRKK